MRHAIRGFTGHQGTLDSICTSQTARNSPREDERSVKGVSWGERAFPFLSRRVRRVARALERSAEYNEQNAQVVFEIFDIYGNSRFGSKNRGIWGECFIHFMVNILYTCFHTHAGAFFSSFNFTSQLRENS